MVVSLMQESKVKETGHVVPNSAWHHIIIHQWYQVVLVQIPTHQNFQAEITLDS